MRQSIILIILLLNTICLIQFVYPKDIPLPEKITNKSFYNFFTKRWMVGKNLSCKIQSRKKVLVYL